MTGPTASPESLVVGIGPPLRGDDSSGPMAVARWQKRWGSASRPPVKVICLEAPGLSLLDVMDGRRKVVLVDAVNSGALPGTLHQLSIESLQAFCSDGRSAHGWGVGETLALARLVCPERLPEDLQIVGIEVDGVELGRELSPLVTSCLDGAADLIETCVQSGPKTMAGDSA